MATVEKGKVVSLHYTLTNDKGEAIDRSTPDQPLYYLHGSGELLPVLEKSLQGQSVGDELNVTLSPQEGYGMVDPSLRLTMQRARFPDDADLDVGVQLAADFGDGEPQIFWVTGLTDEHVELDGNHPLAGQTLTFQLEVADIREATLDEVAHGHAHGPDGSHHHH